MFASSYVLEQRLTGEEYVLQLVLQCLPLPKQFPLYSSTICARRYALVSIKWSCDLMIPGPIACNVATLNLSQRSIFLFQCSVCHPRIGNFKSHNHLGMAAMFNLMAVVFNIEKMQCLVN
jgi:hypothetical protein